MFYQIHIYNDLHMYIDLRRYIALHMGLIAFFENIYFVVAILFFKFEINSHV